MGRESYQRRAAILLKHKIARNLKLIFSAVRQRLWGAQGGARAPDAAARGSRDEALSVVEEPGARSTAAAERTSNSNVYHLLNKETSVAATPR